MSAKAEVEKVLNNQEQLTQLCKAAFDSVDEDGSGFLELTEMKKVMSQVAADVGCEAPSEQQVMEVMKELDVNGDEKISFEEFKVLIIEVLKGLVAEME